MKTTKLIILMAVLTMAWGCSSDNDEKEEQWNNSTFALSEKPTWMVDWSSTDSKPDWKNPDPTKFDPNSSMSYLVELDEELTRYSTDNDLMAVFINDECRGVSTRNLSVSGKVRYLLHVKGTGSEAGYLLKVYYYCDKLHSISTIPTIFFVPGNLISKTFQTILHAGLGNLKYPVCTLITAVMPQTLPFTISGNDMLAVFVGSECRGVGQKNTDGTWQLPAYSAQKGETAQLRYYSAEKGGVYTILKTIKLEGSSLQENISF